MSNILKTYLTNHNVNSFNYSDKEKYYNKGITKKTLESNVKVTFT